MKRRAVSVIGRGPGAPPRVREVMTPDPRACLPDDTAQHAAILMKDSDAGIVPVVDDPRDRRLVGVVTDRDLCLSVVAQGREAHTPVSDCMSSAPVTCDPEDRLDQVLELMEERRIRRVVVVDETQRVQGIVSVADLVRRGDLPGPRTRAMLERI
jgi:CBS domain-containing protein